MLVPSVWISAPLTDVQLFHLIPIPTPLMSHASIHMVLVPESQFTSLTYPRLAVHIENLKIPCRRWIGMVILASFSWVRSYISWVGLDGSFLVFVMFRTRDEDAAHFSKGAHVVGATGIGRAGLAVT